MKSNLIITIERTQINQWTKQKLNHEQNTNQTQQLQLKEKENSHNSINYYNKFLYTHWLQ